MKRRTSGSRWRLLVHDAKGRALTKARHFASYPMRNLSPDLGEITHLPDTEFDELVVAAAGSSPPTAPTRRSHDPADHHHQPRHRPVD